MTPGSAYGFFLAALVSYCIDDARMVHLQRLDTNPSV